MTRGTLSFEKYSEGKLLRIRHWNDLHQYWVNQEDYKLHAHINTNEIPPYKKQSLSTRCKTGMYNFLKNCNPVRYLP